MSSDAILFGVLTNLACFLAKFDWSVRASLYVSMNNLFLKILETALHSLQVKLYYFFRVLGEILLS